MGVFGNCGLGPYSERVHYIVIYDLVFRIPGLCRNWQWMRHLNRTSVCDLAFAVSFFFTNEICVCRDTGINKY